MKLLADTGALIALFHPRDALHQPAARFVKAAAGTRFVVTELILSETVTRIRARVDADVRNVKRNSDGLLFSAERAGRRLSLSRSGRQRQPAFQ